MKFNHDIVSIDIATTGVKRSIDRIIRFTAVKFNITEDNELRSSDSLDLLIKPSGNYEIVLQAYLVHGITPKMLDDKPHFKDVAQQILDFCDGCDILTYDGTTFDIPFIEDEFSRCGMTFDFYDRKCYDIYREEERRNSNSLEKMYERYTSKNFDELNRKKFKNTCANALIFKEQYTILPYKEENIVCTDGIIEEQLFNGKNEFCFTQGKYRGLPIKYVKKIDEGYVNWILNCSTFSDKVKEILA